MALKKERDIYTLNQLATSGLLFWRDKGTVRKYVDAYADIFEPRIRGEGRSKRYVIAKANILRFVDLFKKGELRDFKRVRAGQSRIIDSDFISIADADSTDRARRLRAVAERVGLRVDVFPAHNRRLFMGALGSTVRTHQTVALVVHVEEGRILFPDGTAVGSTDVRRIPRPVGIKHKCILIFSDNAFDKRMELAFRLHDVRAYQEVIGTSISKKIQRWLRETKEKKIPGSPKELYKRKSPRMGRKKK